MLHCSASTGTDDLSVISWNKTNYTFILLPDFQSTGHQMVLMCGQL